MSFRFTPSLETLGERANPSATATEMARQVSVVVEMAHELEGQECLVFYLGGIADAGSGDMTMKGSKIGENAPAEADEAEPRRNQVTLLSADLDRPGAAAGTHALYQDIVIPPASVDPSDPSAAAAGDSFYGTGVYKSVDSGRTW